MIEEVRQLADAINPKSKEGSNMIELGSSNHIPNSPERVVANAPDIPGPTPIERDDPEFISALGIIVSAFVDLGLGVSAAQQAQRAANEDQNLVRIAADFPNQSS